MRAKHGMCRTAIIVVFLIFITAGIEGYNIKGHWPFNRGSTIKEVQYNLNLYNLIPYFQNMFGNALVAEAIEYIEWAAHEWSIVPNQILWLERGEDVDFCDYDNSDHNHHIVCTENIEDRPSLLMYVEIDWDSWNEDEILDADMIINSNWQVHWTLDPEDTLSIDFPSVLLHEFGHFCGLGDSNDQETVMYHIFDGSRVKRELSQDDKYGLISLYSIKKAADGGGGGGGGLEGCFSRTFDMFSSSQDYSRKGWLWSSDQSRPLSLTREQAALLARLDALGIERYPLSEKVKEVFSRIIEKSSSLRKEEAVELKDRIFDFLFNYSDYLESYFQDGKSRQALNERVITADDVNTYKKLSESVCRLIDDVNLIEEIRRSVIFLASFEGESILLLRANLFSIFLPLYSQIIKTNQNETLSIAIQHIAI